MAVNNNKIKIMHFYTYPENSGGPLTYIKTICDSSLKDIYQFKICYQNKPLSKLRIKDIKCMVKEIKEFQPDILHVHGLQGEGFMGALIGKIAKCKCILMTVHGLQQDDLMQSNFKRLLFKYIFEPLTLKMSNAIYCVCKSTDKREIFSKYSKKMRPYIYSTVHKGFSAVKYPKLRNGLGILDDDIVVIICGRVSVDKGMMVLEKIILNDEDTKIKYLIIGSGQYLKDMKNKMEKQIKTGKVIFAGQQSNVAQYLSISDIYLSVSLHENLSIAALEACSYSLPCVVSRVGGNPEIVIDGINGYVVETGNFIETLDKIHILSNSKIKRKKMGTESKERFINEFSEKIFIKKINALYREIAEINKE